LATDDRVGREDETGLIVAVLGALVGGEGGEFG
jgi:hypothetical protein